MRYEETWIQTMVVRFLRSEFPDVIFTHCPAVAKNARQGKINKAMGYYKGFPDLFIAQPSRDFHGLLIELKSHLGTVSTEQKNCHAALREKGYRVVVCYNLDDAIVQIIDYLKK